MLPLSYYFRNGNKKAGYVRGRIERDNFKELRGTEKDTNLFVKKLVDSVLEDQEKRINDSITTYEIEINDAEKSIKKLNEEKSAEELKNSEKFNRNNAIFQKERAEEEEKYVSTCLADNQKLLGAKELLSNLLRYLSQYSEDVHRRVSEQAGQLITRWNGALRHNTRLTIQEIREAISPNIPERDKKEKIKGKIDGKSIGYLRILVVLCVFDVILGYMGIIGSVRAAIENKYAAMAVAAVLALLIIPIAILIVHAAIVAKEKGGSTKKLGDLIIAIVVILLFYYACQSIQANDWNLIKQSLRNIFNVLQKNTEFLIRCFIIPSLFAGEIFIDLINWDSVVEYIGIGKEKTGTKLGKLITNGLLFLKKHKISSYAKEERKAINDIVLEMSKEELPAFKDIQKNINEIEGFLNPILDSQAKKTEEYNKKIAKIQENMDKNLEIFNKEQQRISEKYQPKIASYENTKKINELKIHRLKQDLNQASSDVKEGIGLGLIE